jgi:hypothetical protein
MVNNNRMSPVPVVAKAADNRPKSAFKQAKKSTPSFNQEEYVRMLQSAK